ncbi:transferase family hexapeptide repeat protein [Roseivirga ehrenbergii]|uniref:acyltransferase n=1 Tax=Roseivirga ehrenbergii (strain DSM 102268 / JCM 13514 / KCTC 12282 / NCIMB 14502 / KMM 6017) TaxID=279360 RepID=UPI0010D8968F|nr:acyltransferase [Roseivirga ehrenbergii]TCL14462.1 transferase family hexapeptide repeat protein [Roseivirga ehrenbergii]
MDWRKLLKSPKKYKFTLLGDLLNIRLPSKFSFGHNVIIDVKSAGGGTISFGENIYIGHNVLLASYGGNIKIGDNCSINPSCILYGHGGLEIGNNVRIAAQCVFIPANHIFDDLEKPIYIQGLRKEGIIISDDVWFGAGVKVLDGVKVGKGAVVAAGAVLNKDVNPFEIVGGVPAKVIGNRLK